MRHFFNLLVAVASTTICAAPSWAQTAPYPGYHAEPMDASDQEFEAGRAAHAAARYEEALQHYRRSWALRPSVYTALNLGTTEVTLRLWPEAATHLAIANQHRNDMMPLHRARLSDLFNEAKVNVGEIHVEVTRPGAVVLVDGRPAGTTPIEIPLYLTPGPHTVKAQINGVSDERQIEAVAGASASVRLDLNDGGTALQPPTLDKGAQTVPPPAVTPRIPWQRPGVRFPVIFGGSVLTAAALGAGTYFALHAGNRHEKYDDLRLSVTGNNSCASGFDSDFCNEIGQANKEWHRARTSSYLMFGTAGLLAAGTVTFALLTRTTTPPRTQAGAFFDGNRGFVTLLTRF